jgi:enoyl-CoA hydratase/carnithine racemase
VNAVVPHDQLAESTERLATVVAASAGAVLADAKRALLENLELPLAEAYAHAGEGMARSAASPYAREGVAAFLERRAPVWPA